MEEGAMKGETARKGVIVVKRMGIGAGIVQIRSASSVVKLDILQKCVQVGN